ncbi:hypothetical protein D3C84_1083530 [compost metagenome]
MLRHLPDLHVGTDQPQHLLARDVHPIQRLGRRIPERTFAELGPVFGNGSPLHETSCIVIVFMRVLRCQLALLSAITCG